MFSVAQNGLRRVRKAHRASFPPQLYECGAISRNLQHAIPATRRGSGRQNGGGATSARQASGTKSSSDEGDGEPPRLYTYLSFSQIVDCNVKTLRNKVSCGLFPRPIETIFGPRFTLEHLRAALAAPRTQPHTDSPPRKKRGRPRIANCR